MPVSASWTMVRILRLTFRVDGKAPCEPRCIAETCRYHCVPRPGRVTGHLTKMTPIAGHGSANGRIRICNAERMLKQLKAMLAHNGQRKFAASKAFSKRKP